MTAIKISELKIFDAADDLTTPELVMEYLNAVLAEKDGDFLQEALETVARAPAMTALTDHAEVARSVLKQHPDFGAMVDLVAAMGLKLQVVAA